MDTIALKSNKKICYSIFQFINMTETQREQYRDNMVCIECGGNAYYRGPSKDGKNACFGAKHIGDCDLSSNHKSNNDQGDEEVNEIDLETSQFEIRWNYTSSNTDNGESPREIGGDINGENKRKYTKKPPVEGNIKIGLNQILEFAELDIINNQDYLININNEPMPLKDIVVNIENIDDSNLKKEMFYWGGISSFNGDWLNTPYKNKVSIIIDNTISEKFWKIYRKKLLKIIKSNAFIIWGKVRKSMKGNYYISLKDTKQIYFKKSRHM